MNPCHVWIRFKLPEEKLGSLQREFPRVEFRHGADKEEDLERVDVLYADEPFTNDLAQRMPNLRWLHVTRGGVYPFLCPALTQRPIQVTTSTGIHGQPFSEFGLACIFALAKKLPQCWEAQKNSRWARLALDPVAGKTVAILGLGTVGSELAKKAKALGLTVLATKGNPSEKPAYVDELGPAEHLPELLPRADFVVVCLPSVPATEKTLGEKELRSMKKSAFLINLTAGKVVEEKLLVRALKENWIAGAALDAFARVPLPEDSELWRLPNVLVSPRVAGTPNPGWDQVVPIFAENLKRFLAGEKLRNLVDKQRGY